MVGAGKGEGSMDAGNMLKPALARGELHCIGATTLNEYRKYIEKDAALERRFQKVQVDEPTIEDTIAILRGLKERYEVHHGVRITDPAVIAAATLSNRYITDRFLPDKAIDLIDEAGARLRIRRMTAPPDLREFDERISTVVREKEAAIDGQDFEKAARLRDEEQKLSVARAEREKEWKNGDMDVVAEVDEELDRLSAREREVMRLIARGYQYKEVAKELFISVKTVETHMSAVLRKLQLSSRHELTRWASDRRLL